MPPLKAADDCAALCSSSGFLALHPGERKTGTHDRTRLSVVDRIVIPRTGDERRYPEYRKVCKRLRRLARKRLVASTLLVTPSGEEFVVTRPSWTQAAVDAYKSGSPFRYRPFLGL